MPNKNQIIIGIVSVLALIPLLYGAWLMSSQKQPQEVVDIKILPTDHVYGNKEAKNIFIEYSDFQCPACASYEPILKQFREKESSSTAFVYRHFPLPQHPNSTRAAQASEAAGKQDKFWEMHDLLFEKQQEWETSVKADELFQNYAKTLKLDLDKFNSDYKSEETSKKIQDDFLSGNTYQINATPTFILNGKKLTNIRSIEDIIRELK